MVVYFGASYILERSAALTTILLLALFPSLFFPKHLLLVSKAAQGFAYYGTTAPQILYVRFKATI